MNLHSFINSSEFPFIVVLPVLMAITYFILLQKNMIVFSNRNLKNQFFNLVSFLSVLLLSVNFQCLFCTKPNLINEKLSLIKEIQKMETNISNAQQIMIANCEQLEQYKSIAELTPSQILKYQEIITTNQFQHLLINTSTEEIKAIQTYWNFLDKQMVNEPISENLLSNQNALILLASVIMVAAIGVIWYYRKDIKNYYNGKTPSNLSDDDSSSDED